MTPRQLPLPDLAALGISWPALKRAIAEHHSLWSRYSAAATAEDELIRERPEAEQRDREALATALRAGKADPGQQALQEHDRRIAEARRQREALAIAVEDSAADLARLVDRQRSAWQRDMEQQLAQDRQALAEAIRAAASARQSLHEHRALAAWLDGFPARTVYRTSSPPVAGVLGRNGDPVPAEGIFDALLAETDPPAERSAAA